MPSAPLPKMMLGFVIRRCAVAVGHEPSPAEFAHWANAYPDGKRTVHLFGRPISEREAQVILRHRSRPVAARSASANEELRDEPLDFAPGKVTSLDEVRMRLLARRRKARTVRP